VTDNLILVLYKHRQLGWRFNLYLAEWTNAGYLLIQGPPNISDLQRQQFTDDEKELIRLLEASSDRSLMKKYSKAKSVTDFLNKLKPETFETLIRPAIEIYVARIFPLAQKTGISIYFRTDLKRTVLYPKQKIQILPEETHCRFNFIKDEAGLRYFITLTNGCSEISLKGKPEIVIAEKPAIILVDMTLCLIEDIETKQLAPFYTKDYVAVPASIEQKYMQDFVLKMFLRYPVKLTGIELLHTSPKKQAQLSLETDFENCLYLRLTFLYEKQPFNPVSKKKIAAWINPDNFFQIQYYERDADWEQKCIQQLSAAGLHLKGDDRFYLPGQEENNSLNLIVWINQHQKLLSDFILQQNQQQHYYTDAVQLKSSCDTKQDWFDVKMQVIAGNFVIPFTHFKKNILSRQREYILPDHSVFILPEEWFAHYSDLFQHGEKEGDGIRLKKIHFSLLDKIFGEEKKYSFTQKTPEKQYLTSTIPPHLDRILRPYQKEGFYWLLHLHHHGFGGCLADDMGLGKTLQTLTLLQYIYGQSLTRKAAADNNGQLSLFDEETVELSKTEEYPASLIVVPTSLLHNWQHELQRFTPNLKIYLYVGNTRYRTKDIGRIFNHYQVIITSYGTLRKDIEFLQYYTFHYLILDESQYVKNVDSQIYKAVKQIQASHRLILTGTPIENTLSDLWTQFNFINEGLLGSYAYFQKTYAKAIVKTEDKALEERLLQLIKPFILRRTKEEVTPDLPPVSQEIIYCDMSESQQKNYENEKSSLRNNILETANFSLGKDKLIALQGLMRLRLLANHPSLVHPEYSGDSGKYEQIILSFESLRAGGHKVLIFSSFVKHLKLIAREFDKQGWKYSMLTGQTAPGDREKEIARFTHTPDIHCFFISLKAGGTGLNLVAADYVFIIDPWWNPAAELQAFSRAHRIGQDKNVMVYRFISTGTIEEKMLRLQEQKMRLSNTFIFSSNPLENMSSEEIRKLFD
jgi:SNF2 family DNA or RNA helicase